ncbi:hypothetical protein [Lignipirellula cremea]|uniref:Tetratricopeptide repeat protein n=1 Tax=Lignipirellula cremea TaxID=2528010 RepID=A0A518E1Y5_9BACT|nr:hypothetical protein [Lignipirellula cremea]QDU98083.1 hypothetical protein Pla8534_59440 [Lignipirellula cremea]
MSNPYDPAPPAKSSGSMLFILGGLFGVAVLICGGCCVCAPILSMFVETDLKRAHQLWEEGKKQEAVEVYATVLESSTRPDALALKRAIEYHFENDDQERATHFIDLAVEKNVKVSLDPQALRDLYAEAKTVYLRKGEEAKEQARAAVVVERDNAATTEAPLSGDTPEDDSRQFRGLVASAIGAEGLSFMINDSADDPAQKVIQIRWDVDDNLTNSLIRRGAMMDLEQILKAASDSGISCAEVTAFGSFAVEDKLGNATKDLVIKATYSGDTIGKINWSKFLTDNVLEIADDTWEHPMFRE